MESKPIDKPVCVEGLSRAFGSKQALNDVSLSVPRGCVFGLLGESGAGKTTLMRHLLGLMKPQSGTVRVAARRPRAAVDLVSAVRESLD